MIEAVTGASLVLELVLADGSTTRFPRATVYDSAGALHATVNLTHVATGLYQGSYTPAVAGHFSAIFIVYTDAGHTTVANQYDREAEHILVRGALATASALATVQADTDDIQGRIPAVLVGGRIDASVGAMAANVLTATSIAADAITASKIAPDAIGASELAADAVVEIQSGLATAAAVAGVQADTDDLQTRLPASLSGGRMRSQVEGMDADVITGASIAAGAITSSEAPALANLDAAVSSRAVPGDAMDLVPGSVDAGAIATDAIDADAIAASAVAEIQAGLATAAAVAGVQADTDDIQGRIPASLSGGRIRSQVEGLDADTVTAAALAADAVTEIQAGLATAAAVASLTGASVLATTTVAAGSTATNVRTTLTQADGFFDDAVLLVFNVSGPAVRQIERYLNANGAFTPDRALPFIPMIGDTVLVLASPGPRAGGLG